ncbi:phosphotransferase [Pseudonocardia tropica]|uniref:Phosphotransferase n=1 Tax=Pseudonocardia tropica TaxID=681289 RepID=A0ABV1K224_9PSEU
MSQTEPQITAALVRELLQDQPPDLAALPLCEVEDGWGNQMWRLSDELAVRIQRMDATPEPQLKERRWLPRLAPHLPLPIPVPVRTGAPCCRPLPTGVEPVNLPAGTGSAPVRTSTSRRFWTGLQTVS